MFDRYYDEIAVGDARRFSGVTVTEAHVVGFAGITGDHYPLHVDAEYAAASRYGQRVAHGFLVLSLSAGLFPMKPSAVVAFYGMQDVRFLRPTFLGDTLSADMRIVDKRDSEGGGVVSAALEMVNQHDKPVARATLQILMSDRASATG